MALSQIEAGGGRHAWPVSAKSYELSPRLPGSHPTASLGSPDSQRRGYGRARVAIVELSVLVALALIAEGLLLWSGLAGIPALDPPADVRVVVSTPTSVEVRWATPRGVSDIDHYLIVRDGQIVGTAPVTRTSYTDSGLFPGSTHGFWVVAVSVRHATSQSARRYVTLPVPTPVALAARSVGAESVSLSWGAPQTSPRPDRYIVFRDGTPVATLKGTVTSYTDSGLAVATVYRYAVVAAWGSSSSPRQSSLLVRTLGPAPTALTAAAVTATTVKLYWYPPEERQVPDAYVIIVNGAERVSVPGSSTSFVSKGLLPATSYTFQVGARLQGELSELSRPLQVSTLATDAPLDGPYTVQVTTSAGHGWTETWLFTSKCAAATCEVVTSTGDTAGSAIARFSLPLTSQGARYTGQGPAVVTGCSAPRILTLELAGPTSGQWQAWIGAMTLDPPDSTAPEPGTCPAERWTATLSATR